MPNRHKKNESRKIYSEKDGKFLVQEINDRKKITTYYIRGDRQSKFLSKITLQGFVGLPPGLYLTKDGYGIKAQSKGYYFLEVLSSQINPNKPLDLIISSTGRGGFKEFQHKTRIMLPFKETTKLLNELIVLNRAQNNEVRKAVASFLSSTLNKNINISQVKFGEYHGGELSVVLNKTKINTRLTAEDLKAFSDFFEKAFKARVRGTKQIVKDYKIKFAKESRKLTEKVYLADVINEFEQKFKRKTGDENDWQVFLKERVFPFLTGYVDIIDKENIGVDEKYPDFVLLDVYGFADVFEIKTHKTLLLVEDSSHGNYYWRGEVAEAISQLENYLDTLNLNKAGYIEKISRKRDLSIKIIKPRGYIVAGSSSEFYGKNKEKMEEDFRRLSKSLKNIDFILFDELLANLKNIKAKLE